LTYNNEIFLLSRRPIFHFASTIYSSFNFAMAGQNEKQPKRDGARERERERKEMAGQREREVA
jgi:hypothetical protein